MSIRSGAGSLVAAIAIGVAAFAFAGAETARACFIVALEDTSHLRQVAQMADVIVVGQIDDARGATAQFGVETYYGYEGGPAEQELTIENRRFDLGADCSLHYRDEPRYEEGRYLAFLEGAQGEPYEVAWFGMAMLRIEDGDLYPWAPFAPDESVALGSLDEVTASLEASTGAPRAPVQEALDSDDGDRDEPFIVAGAIAIIAAGGAGYWWFRRSRPGAR